MLLCRVNFLDDTHYEWKLERNAVGLDLFNKVCEHLNLLERDYYGLAMWDSPSSKVWLDCSKEIRKQIKGPVAEFFFSIKFYPPDPSILAEDITRYHLCLQLRQDIITGRLPCPTDILVLLGSYTVQSTLGDYEPNLHMNNYVSEIVLIPNQSEELEERIIELHSTYRPMSPAQADMLFLESATKLPTYGVDLHNAKDGSGADVMLGVCSEGLMVYEDEIKTDSFLWPRVLKISHKRNTFLLKMRSSEQDESEGVVSFILPNYRACKQLWKSSVEQHSFFRNRLQDTKTKRFLTLGSRFRYQGRTQSECQEASANISRPPPQFLRFTMKRKANEDILDALKEPLRTELDDWYQVYGSDKWLISAADDVMLESKKLKEWKQQADDWFVLLDSGLFPTSGLQQPLQTEEERQVEAEEWKPDERLTDEAVTRESYTVHVVHKGPDEMDVVERHMIRDVIEKEHSDYESKQVEEVIQTNGERIQRVVITKQWTQEVNSFGEPQEDVIEKKMERVERVETVERRVMVSEGEKTFERLEITKERLQEVEDIEQKIQEIEKLRVGLQEVETLEQRLHQVQKEGLQPVETADWYILLDRSPSMLTTTLTAKEEWQDIEMPKPTVRTDDWYILLETLPQTIEMSPPVPVVTGFIHEEDQTEEERTEVEERKKQQEPQPPEETKIQTKEVVTVELYERTREVEKKQMEPAAVEDRRPEPVNLEQKAAQTQRDLEDDWSVILDVSPKKTESVGYSQLLRTTEMYEETIQKKQEEQEDDWFIILDVSPKESEPLVSPPVLSPAVKMYEDTREEVTPIRVRTEEQVTQVTVSPKEQDTTIEKKRMSVVQTPQEFPVVPRDIDDVWFQLLESEPYEQRSSYSASVTPETRFVSVVQLVAEETKTVERSQIVEPVMMEDRRPQTFIPEVQPQRDVDDDWFIILDVSPKVSEPLAYPQTTVELYEDTREEVIQKTVKREKQVMEVVTISTEEQAVITERKRTSVVQKPQEFPVVPREIDDDWIYLFDPEPYEQRSFPLDVRSRDVEIQEPAKEQRVQRIVEKVVEEPMRITEKRVITEERRVITEEKRVITDERKVKVDVLQQMFPVGVREIEDDWFMLLDPTPFEERSIPSDKVVSIDTEERRMKEQQERKMKEQEVRKVREDEERRRREQEKQKQELEVRRAPPKITVQEIPQPQREIEDDWFILLDVSPKETVVPLQAKVQQYAETIKVDKRAEEERMRKEEERRRQIQVDYKQKRPAVQQQREVEDDWFTLMGVSTKDSVSIRPLAPFISPVAQPKPRPQVLVDQPLTSTPTAQPPSVTKITYQERTKDISDISLESETDDESMLRRSRRWAKRIEGESIYVRHSILMLEDSDVTQEVILRHHSSVTELKRNFMEAMTEFGPTEWDRRLSSYLPMTKAQLPHANGDILISMGLIEDHERTVI